MQLTAAVSVKPVYSCYNLVSSVFSVTITHTGSTIPLPPVEVFAALLLPAVWNPTGILLTGRPQSPPLPSLLPAHSLLQFVCEGVYMLLSPSSLPHTLRVSPTTLRDHGKSLHSWGDRGWLAFICLHRNAVSEGGQSGGEKGHKCVCVCVWMWVCVFILLYSTHAMSLLSTLYRRGFLLICFPEITTPTSPPSTPSSASLASSRGSQICLHLPKALRPYSRCKEQWWKVTKYVYSSTVLRRILNYGNCSFTFDASL